MPVKTEMNLTDTNTAYCANCIHCKVFRVVDNELEGFYLRVRCTAGKWKKKTGAEKVYKYFTVDRRISDNCPAYTPMGESRQFLKELRKELPFKDTLYKF